MAAPKGFKPPNAGKGRAKGVPNKFTRSVKEAVQAAFDAAQADTKHPANLNAFARAYPVDFMKLSAKLIPVAVEGEIKGSVFVQAAPGDEKL